MVFLHHFLHVLFHSVEIRVHFQVSEQDFVLLSAEGKRWIE